MGARPRDHSYPMKHRRFYVRQYGVIWSMTRAAFRDMLEVGAKGQAFELDDYGRRIKRLPYSRSGLGYDARMVYDWDQGWFAKALELPLDEVRYLGSPE